MNTVAIILSAGKSSRMGTSSVDKTTVEILGKPIFAYSLEAFMQAQVIDQYVFVYKESSQVKKISQWIDTHIQSSLRRTFVQGGKERQDSVWNALNAIENQNCQFVFVHDAARPLIDKENIKKLFELLQTHPAVALAHPVSDTIKMTMPNKPGLLKNLDRSHLLAMETPQAFEYKLLLAAYKKIYSLGIKVPDETSALYYLNKPIHPLLNTKNNLKLTTPNDFALIEYLLNERNT